MSLGFSFCKRARGVPPSGPIVCIQQVIPGGHLVDGAWLVASAQKMHLRSCLEFLKGLWTERRGKGNIRGVQLDDRSRNSTSPGVTSCKVPGEVGKPGTRCQTWQFPLHRPGYDVSPLCHRLPCCDRVHTPLSLLSICFFFSTPLPPNSYHLELLVPCGPT